MASEPGYSIYKKTSCIFFSLSFANISRLTRPIRRLVHQVFRRAWSVLRSGAPRVTGDAARR